MSWIAATSIFDDCTFSMPLVRFFVTRAKGNMKFHRVYWRRVEKSAGNMADPSIALDGFYTSQDYPEHLRRMRFCDPETNKRLVFLTKNFELAAETIAALYKKRW